MGRKLLAYPSFIRAIRKTFLRRMIIVGCTTFALSYNLPAWSQTGELEPRGNEQPSFDCSTAKTAAARLICSDLDLTRLDRARGIAFQRQKVQVFLPDQPRFIADELAWIRERNERCGLVGKNETPIEILGGAKSCLIAAIRDRIKFLDGEEQQEASNQTQPLRMPAPSATQLSQPQTAWPDPQQAVRSSRFELAKQQGYRPISFQDFKLDGKQLAETKAKLMMQGFYSKPAGMEVLQPSAVAVAMAKQGYGDNFGVPLLAEDAARDVRKYLLNCGSNIATAQLGCPVTLTGHADTCSESNLIDSKNVVCFAVEDGW
jgi:uncharacterized protein